MKRISTVLLALAICGCDRGNGGERSAREIAPPTSPAEVHCNVFSLGDLKMREGPPVVARCELWPLPDYCLKRRYMTVDLNGDGEPEYLIENYAGAHSMSFAVVDKGGKSLLKQRDVAEFGGDRVLVLRTKHHAYYDLLTSSCGGGTISETRWRFNGRRYVCTRPSTYRNEDRGFRLDRTPGAVIARWYCDVFSAPPEIWSKPMTGPT